jgi:hypothetical protein
MYLVHEVGKAGGILALQWVYDSWNPNYASTLTKVSLV